jgi:hypothetical protein
MQAYGLEDGVVVPRRFFEHILMSENLSTIRVVAFFLARAQSAHPNGQPPGQPSEIEASYSELAQATGLCRQSVQEALTRAIEQNYLRQTQPGTFFNRARYQVIGIGCQVSAEEAEMLAEADALLTNPDPWEGEPDEDQTISLSDEVIEPYPNYTYQKNDVPPTFHTCTTFSTSQNPPSSIESINRIEDRIELESKEAVYFSDHPQKVDHSPTYPPSYPQDYPQDYPPQPEVVRISAYLTNMSQDFSLELGDPDHTRSNRTQIHNLWHKSGLSEKDFVAVMYEARKLTKQFAIIRQGEKEPPPGQTRNRMAYFFAVLKDLLGLSNRQTEQPPTRSRPSDQTGRNGKSPGGNQNRAYNQSRG